MTQQQFMMAVRRIYREANASDTENKADWTRPEMAGKACCRHLDSMLHDMLQCGAITQDQMDWLHSTL